MLHKMKLKRSTTLHVASYTLATLWTRWRKSWKQPQLACIHKDASEKHEKLFSKSKNIFKIYMFAFRCLFGIINPNKLNLCFKLFRSITAECRKSFSQSESTPSSYDDAWVEGGSLRKYFQNLPSPPKISNLRNGKFSREVFGSLAVISFASSRGSEISQQDENVKNFQREKGNYLIFHRARAKMQPESFFHFRSFNYQLLMSCKQDHSSMYDDEHAQKSAGDAESGGGWQERNF